MQSTETNVSASRKHGDRDDEAYPSTRRRVLTPARREQNRLAQKAYSELTNIPRSPIKHH